MGGINAFFLGGMGVILATSAFLLIAVPFVAGRRFLVILDGAGLLGADHEGSFTPWGNASNERIST